MSRRSNLTALILGISLLLLSACGGGPTPTATPMPTDTPQPPAMTPSPEGPAPAQFTVTPSPTISPTATPIPPTLTPIPPTETLLPSATPTPTITATATSTPLPPTEPPTALPTASDTATPIPPTATPTSTSTPLPPTNTLPPLLTNTPQPTVAAVLTIQAGQEPQAIAAANGQLWVIHSNGTLQVIAANGQTTGTLQLDRGAVNLTTDGSRLWIVHRDGLITQVDTAQPAVTGRWQLPCTNCLYRAIHWDGNALYTSDFSGKTITRFDPTTAASFTFNTPPDGPTAITSDGYGLLVLHQSLQQDSVSLARYDPQSGEILATIEAVGFPTAMTGNGVTIWLALRDEEMGVIAQYDARTFEQIWQVEAAPVNTLLLAGDSLWSANFTNNTVTRRDATTGAVLAVYPVGILPQALAIQDGFLWVVNRREGTITRLWLGS